MNLDNYFAKFLHKSGGSNRAARREEPTANASFAPVAPARPAAVSSSTDADHAASLHRSQDGQPNLHGQPPDEAAVAQNLLQNSTSLNGGAAAGVQGAPEEPNSSNSSSRATSLKRRREADLVPSPPDSPTTTTPITAGGSGGDVPAAKRVLTRRGASKEDDDDELALLLGSQKARQVKEVDAMLEDVTRAAASPLSSHVGSPVTANKQTLPGNDAASSTACEVGSLAWSTASSRTVEAYATSFQRQFEFELRRSPDLFDAFEPFFKDRALDRIAANGELCQVFVPAPVISTDSVGALPGCTLRAYQVEGVQFLLRHFHRGVSCILADDMGLGKTAQISAFLHTLRQLHRVEGPHLIVAPLSTLTSWTRELSRWAPSLRVVKYHGEQRARRQARAGHHNRHAVFVTTPALLHRDKGFFRKRSWVTVIVDEAHVLKAHDTAITSVSRKLTACYRVAVTGTPVHNNVQEVWSLMSFLYPWLMAGYDVSVRDPVRQAEECAKVLRFIMLRRTKADMELGIPPRVDEPLTRLEPTYVQQQLLSQLTTHALRDSTSGQQLRGHLSHQRTVCNHPLALRLLADEGRTCGPQESVATRMQAAGIPMNAEYLIAPSAKMHYLDATLLPTLKAEGHRCLIFSNFTSTLDLLEAMCHLRGYSYERLDGSYNRVERELSMLRFNHPKSSCFLFLVTTTAGGVGVTLTGADTVILFDAHFNPQLDRQAADRAHRIGQTRTVHVYRLCLAGTVEEHIRDIAARKASLGDFIVEGGQQTQRNAQHSKRGDGSDTSGGAVRVTADDIRAMFQRLEEQKVRQALHSSHSNPNIHGNGVSANGSSPVVDAAAGGENSVSSSSSLSAADALFDRCRTADNAMVKDLINVEENGLPGLAGRRVGMGGGGGLSAPSKQTHVCFCCGDIMHPMEPLYHCMVCPKAYHASCIGEKKPKPGVPIKRQWTCPRHLCSLCGKAQAADGAIFMCDACPRSFCFDCLDPRYLEMDDSGTRLLHIRNTYAGMETEEVEVKRPCYYITCLHCCGVVVSSSSSSEEEEESSEAEETEKESDSDDVKLLEDSDSDHAESD